MRTTVDIDDPILKEVKIPREEKKGNHSAGSSLTCWQTASGRIVPPRKGARPAAGSATRWGSRVDLADKKAVYAAMERQEASSRGTSRS